MKNVICDINNVIDQTYSGFIELNNNYIETNVSVNEYKEEQISIINEHLNDSIIGTNYTISEYMENLRDYIINKQEINDDMLASDENFEQIKGMLLYFERVYDTYIFLNYITGSSNLIQMEENYRNYLVVEDHILYGTNINDIEINVEGEIILQYPNNDKYSFNDDNWCSKHWNCENENENGRQFSGTKVYAYFAPKRTREFKEYNDYVDYVQTTNTDIRANHYTYIMMYEMLSDGILQIDYKEGKEKLSINKFESKTINFSGKEIYIDNDLNDYVIYKYTYIYDKLGLYNCRSNIYSNEVPDWYVLEDYEAYCKNPNANFGNGYDTTYDVIH